MTRNLDIESRYAEDAALSIGDVVAATGVGEATLRAWERRFGFPTPRREPSGHRRYSRGDIEQIRSVVRERKRGLSLAVAIDRVTAEPSGPPSLFAPLRERRPDLLPVRIPKRAAGAPLPRGRGGERRPGRAGAGDRRLPAA